MRKSTARVTLVLLVLSSNCIARSAVAQTYSKTPGQFCSSRSDGTEKFNDSTGFTNTALREKDVIKIYREFASQDLDWAIYDAYSFSAASGKRLQLSRAVVYAGQPFVYTLIQNANGASIDNKGSLPSGFFIPEEHELRSLHEFCSLKLTK